MKKAFFYPVIFLFSCLNLYAQTPLLTQNLGGPRQDWAQAVFTNQQGQTTVLKNTNIDKNKGVDVTLLFLNEDFSVASALTPFGRQKDEIGHQALQLFNGLYAVVGSSNSSIGNHYQGGTDGWFVIYDGENDQPVYDTLIGTRSNDVLFDLLQTPDGIIYACGQVDEDKIWLIEASSEGRILRTKSFNPGKTQGANSILLTQKNQIALGGSIQDKNKAQPFIWLFDRENLNPIGEPIILNVEGETTDILENPEGELLLTGTLQSLFIQPFLAKLDLQKQKINILYEGRERGTDGINQFLTDPFGNFWLAGYNQSHRRGATRNKAWMINMDPKGKILESYVVGGTANDQLNALCIGRDGHIIGVGSTASDDTQGDDTWVLKFEQKETLANNTSNNSINENTDNNPPPLVEKVVITEAKLFEPSGNNLLDSDERAWVQIPLQNTGTTVFQDKLIIQTVTTLPLDVPTEVEVGPIAPGASKQIRIPIKAGIILSDETIKMDFQLERNQSSGSFNLTSKAKAFAKPVFSRNPGLSEDKVFSRTEQITVNTSILNEGNSIAENYSVRLVLPPQLVSENTVVELPALDPGSEQEVQFQFSVQSIYEKDEAFISVLLLQQKGENQSVLFQKKEIKVSLETFQELNTSQEPEGSITNSTIEWKTPRVEESAELEIPTSGYFLPVYIRISSPTELSPEQLKFKLKDDGEPREDFTDITLLPNVKYKGEYQYAVRAKIPLRIGNNSIQLEVNANTEQKFSEPIVVPYNPPRPNLYLLSIGVPHPDLQFSTNDAAEFAGRFDFQEGELYERVTPILLNTKEETTTESIKASINQIQVEYDKGVISDKDVVMFFISTHGITNNSREKFRLKGSDWDPFYLDKTSIDFETELKQALEFIPCKKIVLIDACYSGIDLDEKEEDGLEEKSGTAEGLGEALANLMRVTETFQFISSSSVNETSFEHSAWKNGAFTEAILEALDENRSYPIRGHEEMKPDADENGMLTLRELYEFIRLRVPHLVKGRNPNKSQTPFMPINPEGVDFSIFYYK